MCGAAGHYAVAALLRLASARLRPSADAAGNATAARQLCERYAGLAGHAAASDSDEWLYGRAG